MQSVGDPQREQNRPDDDHRHGDFVVRRPDEPECPKDRTEGWQTGDDHHFDTLNRTDTRQTGLHQIRVEHEQTDGHQDHGVGENIPEQAEGKFGHGVGDGHRTCQGHRETQVIPIAQSVVCRTAVLVEFTRALRLRNVVKNFLRFSDDVLGRPVFCHRHGHDGPVEQTVRTAVFGTADVTCQFVQTC